MSKELRVTIQNVGFHYFPICNRYAMQATLEDSREPWNSFMYVPYGVSFVDVNTAITDLLKNEEFMTKVDNRSSVEKTLVSLVNNSILQPTLEIHDKDGPPESVVEVVFSENPEVCTINVFNNNRAYNDAQYNKQVEEWLAVTPRPVCEPKQEFADMPANYRARIKLVRLFDKTTGAPRGFSYHYEDKLGVLGSRQNNAVAEGFQLPATPTECIKIIQAGLSPLHRDIVGSIAFLAEFTELDRMALVYNPDFPVIVLNLFEEEPKWLVDRYRAETDYLTRKGEFLSQVVNIESPFAYMCCNLRDSSAVVCEKCALRNICLRMRF